MDLRRYKKKKDLHRCRSFIFGEPGGARTRDPLIKSQMLYRLSYRSKNSFLSGGYILPSRKGGVFLQNHLIQGKC